MIGGSRLVIVIRSNNSVPWLEPALTVRCLDTTA